MSCPTPTEDTRTSARCWPRKSTRSSSGAGTGRRGVEGADPASYPPTGGAERFRQRQRSWPRVVQVSVAEAGVLSRASPSRTISVTE